MILLIICALSKQDQDLKHPTADKNTGNMRESKNDRERERSWVSSSWIEKGNRTQEVNRSREEKNGMTAWIRMQR